MAKESLNSRFRLTEQFRSFFQSNQASGILLLVCTFVSLFIANSISGSQYLHFWEKPLNLDLGSIHLHHSVIEWINDGLMATFFLLVGLEIKRELYIGELSNKKNAMLPVLAALGGMVFPALVYLIFNFNNPETISGAGIPTATDIAFAIAIMGLLGDKVPNSLKVFLTALAIIDDLGAILVIAIFYGTSFSGYYLLLSALVFGFLLLLNKLKIHSLWIYVPLGFLLWFLMLHSGIHATLSGVLLAFAVPLQQGSKDSSSARLEKALHVPVTFIIIPLFALANTAIPIHTSLISELTSPASLGIFFGLLVGKPIGIYFLSKLSSRLHIAAIPNNVNDAMIWGAGVLGGIGFTMAMFVTNLAFDSKEMIELGKISVLLASASAAVLGYVILTFFAKSK